MYRLIIADDEQIECLALEHKVRELMPDLELLSSVGDGLGLLQAVQKYRPDIAIVDINMPGLDGLEAIELLRMKKYDLKIIINTSYSDFSYIQRALQLGASDYLLKPGKLSALSDALHKVCEQLDVEHQKELQKQKGKMLEDSLYRVTAEKWMLSLLLDEPDEDSFRMLRENFPSFRKGGCFTAWKIRADSAEPARPQDKPDFSRETTAQIHDCMRELCQCIGTIYRDIYYLFLAGLDPDPEDETDKSREMVSYVCRKMKEQGKYFSVGISRYVRETGEFAGAMHEAVVALSQIHRPGICVFRLASDEVVPAYPFRDMETSLAALLEAGRLHECLDKIQAASGIKKDGIAPDPESFRVHAAVLMSLLQKKLEQDTDPDKRGSLGPLSWREFRGASDIRQLSEWLVRQITMLADQLSGEAKDENPYISKALLYMYEQSSRDLSLEETAEKLGISSFYLSRLFTQERDVSFVEILTDIRVRKAIRLLSENRLSNQEVCQAIGYASTPYFYRVLKKTTGLTVGMIRKYIS